MKKAILTSALAVTLLIIVITASLINYQLPPLFNPVKDTVEDPRILDKYSIGSLRLRNFPAQKISLGEIVNDSLNFQSRSFNFLSDGKKVSGLINLPKTEILNPIVILLRGYVDRSIYSPGVGSQRMGEALASAGIITLAPDFLDLCKISNANSVLFSVSILLLIWSFYKFFGKTSLTPLENFQ